jgi:anaerobic dimethyl sulfoxide reductase subunit B (iron-sulfur subunit)
MMPGKLAFLFDSQVCTGCKTCMVACKDKNDLPLDIRWRRVVEFAGGEWTRFDDGTYGQNVFAYYVSISCNHCQDPICVKVCPSTAMRQDENGIVTVDLDKCLGCRYCEWACPYSAPQFDSALGVMTKCDFCRDELALGKPPACVAACPTRALRFGKYDELVKEYGADHVAAPLPPKEMTGPRFIQRLHPDARPIDSGAGGIANPEEVRGSLELNGSEDERNQKGAREHGGERDQGRVRDA